MGNPLRDIRTPGSRSSWEKPNETDESFRAIEAVPANQFETWQLSATMLTTLYVNAVTNVSIVLPVQMPVS
jgi:hypothetical protein